MELEQYFDFIGPDEIKLKGHRIGIEHIVELFNLGHSPEQIAQDYPGLALEAIYASITYYLHNREDVDAYVLRQLEASDAEFRDWAAHPTPAVERLRKIAESRRRRSA